MRGVTPPAPVGPERRRLGFPEAVRTSFRFLEDRGFRVARFEATLVRYESSRVFANVYHGRSSYEIGVEIDRIGRSSDFPGYSLGSIVAAGGGWEREGFGRHTMFQVSTPEGVALFVPKVAELVQRYADGFLGGSDSYYAQIEARGKEESERLLREWHDRDARRAGQLAWASRDLAGVVAAYGDVVGELTTVERRRAEYARKRIADDR